mmetsp:Transcript_3527/g.5215  ORF Transcript_3527/g.5215 Transcript_3527/m.5215 type:complete len:140 (-) Transcript_3527:282-701(-)|eukprot:CAMPEP_0194099380 /NCGR_PEP_ID=MMETSP0150-20130528/566_1 /TAXON_ID=122233 /ORGANISM="Chaetoceros debilis, Strain MM31A-1" /LENGTH=139 /DNA_ID=CAMNT_0038785577 /DNA_START=58 /DNA_END=477 /DNA_ORIENTATION=-
MKTFFLLLLSISSSYGFLARPPTFSSNNKIGMSSSSAIASKPFTVVVQAEIKADRLEEFLDIIEKDAIGSRAEEGCIRFDVVQSQEDPNKFIFYEVYKDLDAVVFHKEQPHFALWTNFKGSGGVVSSVSHKMDGIFMSD